MKRRGAKVTIEDVYGLGAAAPPRSSDKYARVFESKAERRARAESEGVIEVLARCAEQNGCPYCDSLGEAHLHGATLYENGRALF
jgi:hypothetical protein